MAERLIKKHRETLRKVFRPQRRKAPGISYREMVGLLRALGAVVEEDQAGSRVRVTLAGSAARFHKPHGGRPLDGGTTAYLRRWLQENGIEG